LTNGNGSENDNKRKSGSNLKRPNSKYASKRLRTQVVKEKDSENPELDLESDVELDSDEEGGGGGFNLEELVGISTNEEKVFTPPHRQGSILITLLNQPPYTLWSLPQLAQRPPPCCPGTRLPQPRFRLERSFKFHPELYEGYAHRRTIGFKEGKSKADNEEIIGRAGEARTWEFVKAVERAERE
jgi:25S rRNA (uracil2634-N3)-methyltransferase